MPPPSEQRFAVCSFSRVFDVEPKQEMLTLGELLRFTTRFEVKPQVLQRMRKAVAKVERALERVLHDAPGAGPVGVKIREAMRAAEADGGDSESAARALADTLAHDARQSVKRDMRLWSPVLYREGARRGSEGVIHLSCLVLDYDGGTRIEQASAAWSDWLHVVHSTWSFTESEHKFRVILPLAHAVAPVDWEAVWCWAEERAGGLVDPSGRGVASTFAIPTVGALGWPRRCIANRGPLVDPLGLGLIAAPAPPSDRDLAPVTESLVLGSPKYTYIAEQLPEDIAELPPPRGVTPKWDADDVWDAFGGGVSVPEAARVAAETAPTSPVEPRGSVSAAAPVVVPAPSRTTESAESTRTDERITLLEREVERLRCLLEGSPEHRVPSALERVAALHREGVLDDVEFELAKRTVIDGDG